MTVLRALPIGVSEEDQARFFFRVPDAGQGREVWRQSVRYAKNMDELFDAAKVILGIVLDRVENLKDAETGEDILLEKEDGRLAEKTLGDLQFFLLELCGLAQGLGELTHGERKNSESPPPNISGNGNPASGRSNA